MGGFGEIDPSGGLQEDLARVGARLQELRKERGWKLEDLEERTSLSRSYLSRLESGERQPSLAALFGVARAYDIPLSTLFEEDDEAEGCTIVRAGESNRLRRGSGLFYAPLSAGNLRFNLQPVRMVIPADGEHKETYRHEGEQWLYVLSGKLGLKMKDEEFVLETGDTAHFDAENPHQLTAPGEGDAEIIVVACAIPYLLLKSYL